MLAHVDEDVFSADLQGIAIHAHGGVLADLAGGYVVLPAVPGTRHYRAIHYPLAQRPAPVQAGIVDGVELSGNIGQGNGLAFHLKLPDRSRRNFIRFRCSHKPHLVFSLQVASYLGSCVCATITPFLNSSTICGFKRTSVGRFARVIWSILSCSFNSAKNRPSGRGGHPMTYTSTGTMRSTPCKTEYALNGPPTLEHAPIEMHHLGSGICSHTRFKTGAIFSVTVPATIIRSAWRGDGRKTSAPNRAMSNRAVVEAIISMAQQARPNVSGQMADLRAQLKT